MKIRHPLAIKAIGITGAWTIRRLVGTCNFHFKFTDPESNPDNARQRSQRYIYAFFHEVMLFPAYLWASPKCTSSSLTTPMVR